MARKFGSAKRHFFAGILDIFQEKATHLRAKFSASRRRATLCGVALAIFLSGCGNGKIYRYSLSEQKELFFEHFTQLEAVRMPLSQSEYRQLFIDQQMDDRRYHWTIPAVFGGDDVDKSTLNQTIVEGLDSFCEITKCRSITYYRSKEMDGYRLEISFWDEYGNDGIAYLPDEPDEVSAKFHEDLSDGWYYFAFPAV